MSAREIAAVLRSTLSAGGGPARVAAVLAVIVLVAAAVWAVWRLVGSGTAERRLRNALRGTAERSGIDVSPWALRIGAVFLAAVLLLSIDAYLSSPSTCASCHGQDAPETALTGSPHESVTCMGCHRPRGMTGAVRQAAAYARWLYVYGTVKQRPQDVAARVDDGACLRCHSAVARGTVGSAGVRVRHADFLDAGARCGECHDDVSHRAGAAQGPGMSDCLPCHDGVTAPYECELCHTGDVAAAADLDAYPKVAIPNGDCYGCHDEAPCLRCHGVTMPHPPGWAEGPTNGAPYPGHSRDGFARRDVCYRCHFAAGRPLVPSPEGCTCHGVFGSQHGGKAWIREHGLQATGKKTGVFARCFECHVDAFCSACHPASYNALYAPVSGPDLYRRDTPLDPRRLLD